jgi:hypothetical protein
MDLSSLMSLGQLGLGLFGSLVSRNAYNRQATLYEEQGALNRQLGRFNAEVSERTGLESVKAITEQTKKVLGEQALAFSNRGISLEGSPMFVLGETVTMGSKQAQEAYFNAEVQKVNALYASYGATSTASAQSESARGNAMVRSFDIFKGFLQGAKVMKSSMVVNDSKNIFDISTWSIR